MTETPLVHKFERGDRVKAAADMGWLKLDTVGLVINTHDVGSKHEDAFFRDTGQTVIVAWPAAAYKMDPEAINTAWDGVIEGVGEIDVTQFERPSYPLPMRSAELVFIDNLLK